MRTAEGQCRWHAAPIGQVFELLDTGPEGLSSGEARIRLERHGLNRLPQPRRRGPLARFLAQFSNLLIQVLLAAAVITGLLGHWADTLVIGGVVLLNAVIGFVQEGKAENALQAIRNMLSPQAAAFRDGHVTTLPAEELVPGDVVQLQAGDKVPADLRLFRAKGLSIQESVLTGESVPVAKGSLAVTADAPLGDRSALAYSGTLVTSGQGFGVVAATGAETEIGRISGMLAEVDSLTTPLLRQMEVFARWLTGVVLAVAALLFGFGMLVRDFDAAEAFMTVVGIAVAAIPEGLPAILTVTLAIGVQGMARRNAIIRRLPAVETLGSVSVICSDKTGTLTRNEMTARAVMTPAETFAVAGTGYDPHGDFEREGEAVEPGAQPFLMEVLRAGVLCNDAGVRQDDGGNWQVGGDPMEGALLVLGRKAGIDQDDLKGRLPRTDEIPFESEHRFMATLHHDHEGNATAFLKGAPEQVLEMCQWQGSREEGAPLDREYWRQGIEELARGGMRVLAIAAKPLPKHAQELTFGAAEEGLTLLGLVGLQDPPREEAVEAVAECQAAGIRVKMITGDHASTARAIAGQLAVHNSGDVLTGADLERLSDAELFERVADTDVYARTTPENKLRLVETLQRHGLTVAMTGDGVNDAPALKRADIGIAMGRKGTEAAKEAAEMVLADDNFASISRAVRAGRTVYDNLKKAIAFLLPVNGGESLSIVGALLIGLTLPITPLQILWVNMVSSVALAMALAFEPAEPGVMKRPPRPAKEPLLSGFLLWRVVFVSTLFFTAILGIFAWSVEHGSTLEEARTYSVNTLVLLEVLYLFSIRYLHAPALSRSGIRITRAAGISVLVVVLLQLIFTYAPFMEAFFETRPIDFLHGAEILGIGVLFFGLLEVEKRVRRRTGWGIR
ncbi:cation-transporting P-type ATPase [Thiohalorhabdus methylotrophus]|uniref:Cation-transporting P-type ATPase n=1 Tax=Thiohalorhabdus methylotrophus TaxID=3242694 RepID=A0ABV4TVN4_9GAMM